jgi:hypothetical protein
MKKKARYWRNTVFAALAVGVLLTIVSGLTALRLLESNANSFWVHSANVGVVVACVGVLGWLCLTVPRVHRDVVELWTRSKTGALLTLAIFAFLSVKLQRFTGPHFYGWHTDAWIFFLLALLLGFHLLLKAALAVTNTIHSKDTRD